jgi:hypothetical protein
VDLGGFSPRSWIECFPAAIDAIVFIIDVSDDDRLEESKIELDVREGQLILPVQFRRTLNLTKKRGQEYATWK